MLWNRPDEEAVSEVVGNLLILMITVSLFGVVLGFIYTIPGPEPSLQAEIVPMLERTSATDATLHLQHTGGEPLKEGEAYILIGLNDTPTRYEISDGNGGKTTLDPGDTWTMNFLGVVSTSAKLDVKIVDTTSNSLLFYTVVQRGVVSGGDHDPIIAYSWVDTTSGIDIIPNNDYTTFRLYAVCKDIDGDLPISGSVIASITSTDNGDGTFTVTDFSGGSTDLTDIGGDGVYMSGLLKVATTVLPGDYTFTVTATDNSGRSASAQVTITVSTSYSSLRMSGTDEAPLVLKAGDANKIFLKLEFLANGESIYVNHIRVKKLGNIADNRVTVHCYWDQNRNGALDIGTDYDLPGFGVFGGGSHVRDFTGLPLFTAIEDEPTYVWVVLTIGGGTEGYSVGVRIESQNSVDAEGVSTPIRIPPIGSFPIDSSIRTIKGVFKVWGYNVHPTRILTGTDDVKMIELRYTATGETVYIKTINLTLIGNIDTTEVTVYLKDSWNNLLHGDATFDPITRRVQLDAAGLGWKIDKAWSYRQIYAYLNIAGNNGDIVGVQMDTVVDTHAVTEISADDINPHSDWGEPIPPAPDTRTLQSAGFVNIDREWSATLPTRAGHVDAFQRRWLYRCWGEPIQFFSFNVSLEGTIAYDQVTQVRAYVDSAYPNAITWSMTGTFNSARYLVFRNANPAIPLFTANVNENFYGWVRVRVYISLAHDTEGLTIRTGLANAAATHCTGSVTGTNITVLPYNAGDIPTWADWRTVNGQMYIYGNTLIPDPLVDSSQNVPVLKLTFKCEGQDVRVNSITIRKLGEVAQNLVTVRIYRDVDNDTYNKLDGDDVELDSTHAGSFVGNAITFTPSFWVTVGTDYNVVIAFSLGLGTAGWTLGTRVNANEVSTTTDDPNWRSAYPNACNNLTRNPVNAIDSDTVDISDRGTLTVYMEDLSPLNPDEDHYHCWMKLTFWAEGENVEVNNIMIHMHNNTSVTIPPDNWDNINVFLVIDKDNSSHYNPGAGDYVKQSRWCNEDGDVSFFGFPLFTVKQRVAYNVLLYIYPDDWTPDYVIMNITGPDSIQSKGVVSSQTISPLGAFPLASVERRVWN